MRTVGFGKRERLVCNLLNGRRHEWSIAFGLRLVKNAESASESPNDPKLSDGRGWRDRFAVGERRRQEAAGVTAAPVRCSAWLGVAVMSVLA